MVAMPVKGKATSGNSAVTKSGNTSVIHNAAMIKPTDNVRRPTSESPSGSGIALIDNAMMIDKTTMTVLMLIRLFREPVRLDRAAAMTIQDEQGRVRTSMRRPDTKQTSASR